MTTDVLQLRVIGVVLGFLCYTTSALPHSRNSTAALTNPCGIATNLLDTNDPGMKTFCDAKFGFWWNWQSSASFNFAEPCAQQSFVPMVWGVGPGNPGLAATAAKYGRLMGYNEPDHWGPPPRPGSDVLSSGTFPDDFHCGSDELATNWQQTVEAFLQADPTGQVISPAMADASVTASAGDYSKCDSSPQTAAQHMAECEGWLKCFKATALQKTCGSTNCWDAIDVLQLHAYFYTADQFIAKMKIWESAWADDLNGANGRTKKTLWVTEFAHAGTTDPADLDGEAAKFMTGAVNYMKDSPHVSGWSWFSQTNTSFDSFVIDGVQPKAPFWASNLIDDAGALTQIGKVYADLCADL